MNEPTLEQALHATLQAAAPAEVPAHLLDRARAIPSSVVVPPRWWPAGWRLRTQAGLGVMVVTVLAVGALLIFPRQGPAVGGGAPNPVTIASSFGSLVASDLELTIGSQTFRIPSSAQQAVQTMSLTGSATSGQLTVSWHDGSIPMTLVAFLNANAKTWWVSEIIASDGRTEGAGWVYFEGPLFERPVGTAFTGARDLSSSRSTNGEQASLQFGDLRLRAFASVTPHDPTTGTMPGLGDTRPVPDFIPMVSGVQTVGYIASAQGPAAVPISSFRGQGPDQPVFGPDLKTLVGYSVGGQGFVPLSASPTDPNQVALKTQPSGSLCMQAITGGTLVADSESGVGLETAGGLVRHVRWPTGWTAREDAGSIAIIDANGAIVAHVGDTVSMGGGIGSGGDWFVCPPVQVVAPSPT